MTTDVFAALANPLRRELLSALRERPRTVTELAEGMPVGRPAVSEHLQVLVKAGLVADERRGQHRVYHLVAEPLREVDDWLHPFEHFWRGRLRALHDTLDSLHDTTATPSPHTSTERPT